MILYSQRDPRWAGHALGWGPALGTIGQYGCLNTVFAMIATDTGRAVTPAALDELFTGSGIFLRDSTGTVDLLPDRALDMAFPGLFQTTSLAGYRADQINRAIPSKYSYAVLWISTTSVPTHFVLAYSLNATAIADPWTGHAGYLSGYGGPSAVHKTIIVTYLSPPAVVVITPPLASDPHPESHGDGRTFPLSPWTPEPQPLPVPTAAPAYSRIDRFLALLQAVLIAVVRAWRQS